MGRDLVGTCTSSGVVLMAEARGICFFTVFLSRVSFCIQVFCFLFFFIGCFSLLFYGCVLLSKTDWHVLCGSFDFLVFHLVLKKFENGFQENNIIQF